MKYNDIFTFGKYKGKTYNYVFRNDAQYIDWCLKNIPNFDICETHKKNNYEAVYSEIKHQKELLKEELEFYRAFRYYL